MRPFSSSIGWTYPTLPQVMHFFLKADRVINFSNALFHDDQVARRKGPFLYRRTSISGTKKAEITFPLRHFFPLKVVPLIEVLLYNTALKSLELDHLADSEIVSGRQGWWKS
jgi:hypothetical protein